MFRVAVALILFGLAILLCDHVAAFQQEKTIYFDVSELGENDNPAPPLPWPVPQPISDPADANAVTGAVWFRTMDAIVERTENLATAYGHVSRDVLETTSLLGENIYVVRVSAGQDRNKRPDGQPKPQLLFVGAQHPREWISPETVLRMAGHLAVNYGNVARNEMLMNDLDFLVENADLYFIPVLNPDGLRYTQSAWNKFINFGPPQETDEEQPELRLVDRDGRMRRKNFRNWTTAEAGNTLPDYSFTTATEVVTIAATTYRQGLMGTDINRNFDPTWSSTNHMEWKGSPELYSETYYGTEKYSEPEAAALSEFAATLTRLHTAIDYHSNVEKLIFPLTIKRKVNGGYGSKRDEEVAEIVEKVWQRTKWRTAAGIDEESHYEMEFIEFVDQNDVDQKSGLFIEEVANRPGKPVSFAVELPNAAGPEVSQDWAGFICPVDDVVLGEVTLHGIKHIMGESMRGAAAAFRQSLGGPAVKAVKIWQDDNQNALIDEGEIRYHAEWSWQNNAGTLNVLTDEWCTSQELHVLVTFDQQMWVPPDDADDPQDYLGNPASGADVYLSSDFENPAWNVWFNAQGGWLFGVSEDESEPGSSRYPFDTWMGFINVGFTDASDVRARIHAENLVGFRLDGDPSTVVEWNQGWVNYEDGAGVEDENTGGVDLNHAFRVDTTLPDVISIYVFDDED